jgi:D-3-phosphoglycerate dehydrogenase / 2-oxoglutarate reductase
MNVLLAAPISIDFKNYLIANNATLTEYNDSLEMLPTFQGIITSNKLNIDKQFIDKAQNLQWIARLGSGLEIIDIPYAQAKNIYCCNSPAGIANAVAEHVVAMIISLQKNIHCSANQVAQHQWIREPNRGVELEGKVVGLFGYGHTGSKTAEKLSVFGCDIIACDPNIVMKDSYTKQVDAETLYSTADIVSLHLPLNDSTNNFYQAQNFEKPHMLINTSRGNIANTSSILQGLQTNKIIACGLDVLDFENQIPFSTENKMLIDKLLQYNTIITPHIAGYSFNAIQKMSLELMQKLKLNVFPE